MQFVRHLILLSLLTATALAQSVSWTDAGTGDPADLQLVFEECSPDGTPQLPALNGIAFNFRGQSEQTSIINFSMSRSVILSYRLQTGNVGSVQIPAFKVRTNKGELTVPAYATGTVQPGPEADVQARLRPGRNTVWAGEVFSLSYTIDVARRNFSNFGGGIEWDSTPLLAEDWAKPEVAETTRGGESRLNLAFRTRGYLKSPGTVQLKPISQLLNLNTGTTGFRLFQQQRIDQVSIHTDPVDIKVRPLPLPAPKAFDGAVGQFKLNSKVVPATAAVGEPITWTLELSGTGNWPDIAGLPSRSVSQDFQVISPQAKRRVEEGKLFDATLAEDVVLVPTKPGTYTLGAVEMSYFDPATGTYQTMRTPATSVTVTAAAAPKFNVMPPAASVAQPDAAPKASAPEPPADPTGIPRDPIVGSHVVASPFSSLSPLVALVLAPFGVVLVVWLALAYALARKNDPARSRRLARQQLAATLAALRSATPNSDIQTPSSQLQSPISDLLIRWQHQTAQLWSLHHAAPPPHVLPNDKWKSLWMESDHVLYGAGVALPPDWLARAESVLTSTKVPGTAWWRTLQTKNLLPFLVLTLLFSMLPALHGATDPATDYAAGSYAEAEKGWYAQVEQAPTDWIARHNLSLALAQQERWGEAAAQATAAFVQHPRSAEARWNLAYLYNKAGFTPTEVAPLLKSAPVADLARLASPAIWECVLVISAVVVAVALIGLLLVSYGLGPRWSKWLALVAIVAGVLVGSSAVTGRHAFGIAAQPQTALVWSAGTLYSIPTEADSAQQTTSLAAGSMGTVDQTFLGWARLNFPNGQTGWVRQDTLVYLWK
ncbi:MAG: BatD family protein [Cephaloticoccus sp.]|nr:BatD family protein [Cephaloticoccus sp.]